MHFSAGTGVGKTRLALEVPRLPADAVAEHLRDSETLIVLDNCEHLVGACAQLVAGLLSRTQRIRALATSRQTLGIDASQEPR
jgi:predicted ATPase